MVLKSTGKTCLVRDYNRTCRNVDKEITHGLKTADTENTGGRS